MTETVLKTEYVNALKNGKPPADQTASATATAAAAINAD